jgi:excisionase family DNA binding protein
MIYLAPPTMQPAPQEPITAWCITPKQAAEILNLSERTIHNHIKSGALKSTLIGGSRRIWIDDLLAFAGR